MDHLIECLIREEKEITKILSQIHPMSLSSQEENEFKNAIICHICEQPMGADRVRDHDHLTGKFRGAAHSQCNLQYQVFQTFTFQLLHTIVVIMTFIT